MKILNDYCPSTPTKGSAQGCYLLTVLTYDEADLVYVCYQAIVPLADPADLTERMGAAEWVAAMGRKLPLQQAQGAFPAMTADNYRA